VELGVWSWECGVGSVELGVWSLNFTTSAAGAGKALRQHLSCKQQSCMFALWLPSPACASSRDATIAQLQFQEASGH